MPNYYYHATSRGGNLVVRLVVLAGLDRLVGWLVGASPSLTLQLQLHHVASIQGVRQHTQARRIAEQQRNVRVAFAARPCRTV